MPFPFAVFLFLTLLFTSVLAQDASIVNPTTAAPSATALATAKGYTYVGCWNETVGVANSNGARALSGGMTSANNTMTVSSCLEYCSQGYNGATMQYAGLEYGRECYCGAYLSALSEKLNESARCIYACDGNSSQVCGGALALTLYNLTSDSKTGIAWSLVSAQPAWYSAAALVMLIVAAVL
ncbi:hypothetical protein B0A55_00271 [Friedmanniomyces simplex]|uniref:WSC domain-containing protein n=1 Tax=Friedmanniomyces simplex TaxID=329884 RepID=A0A4U0Y3J1_9PEZI|nr:hypothetical protein B0A55_00271 [Friedmanniomyces simplex]